MDRKAFFDEIRPMFAGGKMTDVQVERIEAVLDHPDFKALPLPCQAYVMATAFHESDQFKTLEEYASGAAYEGRKDLGNTVKGDGKRFKGRGLVQITGRANYAKFKDILGIDLLTKPSLAATLEIAVPILVIGMRDGKFTGKGLSDFTEFYSYREMRRIVNGMDRADLIAGYAKKFEAALREANGAAEQIATQPLDHVPAAPPQEPAKRRMPAAGPMTGLAALVTGVGAAVGHWLGWW